MKFNEDSMAELRRQIAQQVGEADMAFRQTHTGLPVDVIVADFSTHGPAVELSPDVLRGYAEAVSEGVPFVWNLE